MSKPDPDRVVGALVKEGTMLDRRPPPDAPLFPPAPDGLDDFNDDIRARWRSKLITTTKTTDAQMSAALRSARSSFTVIAQPGETKR